MTLLTASTSHGFGQTHTYYVKPIHTDTGYVSTEDSSAVSRNTSFQLNKLFLFIGGTGSSSSKDYNALRLHAANLGFDFINLSYANSVAAASLSTSADSMAFNKYRQEICFGSPVSMDVSVDSLNSIYTRTLKLIQYLDFAYPSENWGQYLATPTTLDWSKIIVGGHSQGSGHACYLAKRFLVDRVLMFSGPNDYSDFYSNSANWIRQPGLTPVERHFSYLSLKDEAVSYFKQFTIVSGLGMLSSDDTTYVDNISSPYGNSHCLYTTQAPGIVILNHNVPIKLSSINNDVWTYMLASATTGLNDIDKKDIIEIFPNPANNFLYLSFANDQRDLAYSIYNYSGHEVLVGVVPHAMINSMIDISDLKTGVYILSINGFTSKFLKLD